MQSPEYARDKYTVELRATNDQDASARTQLDFHVNQPPGGGSCSLASNSSSSSGEVVSLVEAMVWECNSWTDPELAGIAGYTLFSQPSGGQHSVR